MTADDLTFEALMTRIVRTLRDPIGEARALLAENPPYQARVLGLLTVVAISAAIGTVFQLLIQVLAKTDDPGGAMAIYFAPVQLVVLIVMAFMMFFMGQRFGGTGRFEDALLLVVWMQFILVVGQGLLTLAMIFFPVAASIFTLVLVGLMFWLLTYFTAALHGFDNFVATGLGVVLTFFGTVIFFGMILGMILGALGIAPVAVAP